MRLGLYAGTSSALAAGAVLRACLERPNFYSSSVYIAQSNACLFILTNLALLATYSVMLGLQKAFYGPLRPVEIEQLWEKAWFALTETALAMTIFRDEGKSLPLPTTSLSLATRDGNSNVFCELIKSFQHISPRTLGGWFLFMFTFLLISKVWNWLAEGRVEFLEQQPRANPRLFHTRLSAALSLAVLFNLYMLRFCTTTVLQQARPNMMVMFAFEFAVLTILSLSTTARYGLSLYETAVIRVQIAQGRERLRQRTDDPLSEEEIDDTEIDAAGWEEKGLWIFYLDIATDFFKLVLYLTFFCVLCMFYGMPIHIIRDVALTIRSFYKRIRDFVQYKHATRDMNARYPDATAEEIAREDVCIICRENMTVWQDSTTHQGAETSRGGHQPIDERQRAKKLPCGHLLHFACLRSWLERQQICPTCRTPVLTNNPRPSIPNQDAGPAIQGIPGAMNQPAGGPHVYTFGPFRLVLGARQINNPPLPNPGVGAAMGNPSGLMLNRNSNTLPSGGTGIQAQLDQIEQYITREISSLNLLSDQVQVVRALQSELARLRIARNFSGNVAPASNNQMPTQQTVQTYRQVPLDAGHQDFPAGLMIPENWMLHALQRVPAMANSEGANTGPRPWRSFEAPSHQTRPTSTRTQSVSQAPGLDSSGDPAHTSGIAGDAASTEVQAHGSSTPEQNQTLGQAESSRESGCENSPGLPKWSSAPIQNIGDTSGGQTVEDSTRSETPQPKGKGKAVMVEDDTDDVGG